MRDPTEDESRLIEVAESVLGMIASFDAYETFPQAGATFENHLAFERFADACGNPEIQAYRDRHRQMIAAMALKRLYDQMGERQRGRQLEDFFNRGPTLDEGRKRLMAERDLVPDRHVNSLYEFMDEALRGMLPSLKVGYNRESKSVLVYLLSPALPGTVDSINVPADIGDADNLARAIKVAILDIAPNFFRNRKIETNEGCDYGKCEKE